MKLRIQIQRNEGPTEQCGDRLQFDDFKAANECLKRWSDTAPDSGGYDKCDFWIFCDDPVIDYEGRYDLVHWSITSPDLKGHVLDSLGHVSKSEWYSDNARNGAKALAEALRGAD